MFSDIEEQKQIVTDLITGSSKLVDATTGWGNVYTAALTDRTVSILKNSRGPSELESQLPEESRGICEQVGRRGRLLGSTSGLNDRESEPHRDVPAEKSGPLCCSESFECCELDEPEFGTESLPPKKRGNAFERELLLHEWGERTAAEAWADRYEWFCGRPDARKFTKTEGGRIERSSRTSEGSDSEGEETEKYV